MIILLFTVCKTQKTHFTITVTTHHLSEILKKKEIGNTLLVKT